MKVEIEKQDNNVAHLKLAIGSEQAQQEYNKACRRIGQRVNVPGFRRGKAPLKMIEKTVGQDRIKQEALERLLPHAFADAISEHQLDIVAPPHVESFNYQLGQDISVLASVELRPEVGLPENISLNVEVPEFKAPEDQEAKELQSLQERYTTLEAVIDRPAEGGDIVNIDFSGTCHGEAIAGGSAKNFRLDLANNSFIDGFAEQIPGHKLGETFTIEVTFPEQYHEKKLAGQPAQFEVKINDISRRVTPEADDMLAQKVGNYQTLAELKADITKAVATGVENENTQRKQKALVSALLEKVTVAVPDSMVRREMNILLQDVQQRFKQQGINFEDFVQGNDKEAIMADLRKEAENRIKTSLAFGALAKREGLTVTEAEFGQQVQELAQMKQVDEKTVMRQLANNPGAIQALTDQVLATKVVELLTQKATFTLVEDKTEAEPHVHGPHCNHDHDHTHDHTHDHAGHTHGEPGEYELVDAE